ncbi:aspartate kinase [Streptomyces sp. x-80]|uniref:aspartate kinase n=1 Tax=Streptomyces sp. x-80 TaxID=2789282 RepID=UPI00397F86FC
MALIVQKYGGSSVHDVERITRVAEQIVATRKAGHDLVVVVSAMGDTTDKLLDLARQAAPLPVPRELDMLLTAGERISHALVAIAIHALGGQACSFSGPQAGVLTTSAHGRARIIDVVPNRVRQILDRGQVAVVAGFQGLSRDTEEITTLGRGGSDTTAVALAAALKADVCEIYTDVDGVYTADPRIVPAARKLDVVPYDVMQEMAAAGTKVLALRSVEYARCHGVPLHVRSSFHREPGTMVTGTAKAPSAERAALTGIAHDRSGARLTVTGVPDRDGLAARVLRSVVDAQGDVDIVVRNASAADGHSDLTIVLSGESGPAAVAALEEQRTDLGFARLAYDEGVGKVSLVGSGIRTLPGVTAAFCAALAAAGIGVDTMTTSELRISALCGAAQLDDAVRALHDTFDLATPQGALVGAGSGR